MTGELDVKLRMLELEALDRSGLRKAWRKKLGQDPPNYISMGLMRKVLLWEDQCAATGGIPPYLMRALRAAATNRGSSEKVFETLKPGALLIREWNGRSYQVEVTRDGFRFDGRDYRSLSAISRKITGTTWSGPKFFGLVSRKSPAT